jgi:hypothetical protein
MRAHAEGMRKHAVGMRAHDGAKGERRVGDKPMSMPYSTETKHMLVSILARQSTCW